MVTVYYKLNVSDASVSFERERKSSRCVLQGSSDTTQTFPLRILLEIGGRSGNGLLLMG